MNPMNKASRGLRIMQANMHSFNDTGKGSSEGMKHSVNMNSKIPAKPEAKSASFQPKRFAIELECEPVVRGESG
jgi:hypothetical protein